ncbi:MAG: ion transporter [Psychromonas sp.]
MAAWRTTLHEVIFEADTPMGKAFDILLIVSILVSVIAVMLDSIVAVRLHFGSLLFAIEWLFTIIFTVEYILRLICIGKPFKYAISFYGIVDLLAIIPTFVSLFLPGSHYLLVIRILRILRIFRILKLAPYIGESKVLMKALRASSRKITVFIYTVMTLVVIFGSLMYIIEGGVNGFTSIPRSIYWAIVTLTTVGYGDISPQTVLGQTVASMVMITGYAIIAVPTGIVTVEMSRAFGRQVSTQACPQCSAEGHDADARYCKFCGAAM